MGDSIGKYFVIQTNCVAIIWPVNSKYCISLSLVASKRFLVLPGKSQLTRSVYYVNTFFPKYSYNAEKNLKEDHHQGIPEVHPVPCTV